jgi:hypothetical protein
MTMIAMVVAFLNSFSFFSNADLYLAMNEKKLAHQPVFVG